MSKVIINKKYIQSKVKRNLLLAVLMSLTGIAGIIILTDFGKSPSIYLLFPFVFLLLPSSLFFISFRNEKDRVKKDDAALKDLAGLPSDYTVLRNVYVPYNNDIIECDFLVIGRNGIFVLEVNGAKGYIHESKDTNYWLRYKTKKKTKMFIKAVPNQRNIVDVKVIALMEYLQRFKIHTWIQGIVYFSGKKTELDLLNSKAVFGNPRELQDYITQFPTKVEIDENKKEKIEKLLHLDTLAK